ncbi:MULTISPECIES: NADPH-dependent FMN reductase [Streptomyces]|uniref:NADPH-dependent FMN reductase n=1 Tax=Streptomyces TaxID=1883 RepID=UPI00292EFC67|nr:NAD(P)H-dependent oxidoreductase [Streptomyces sp. NEAU-HV9]
MTDHTAARSPEVLIVCGSVRPGGHTQALTRYAAARLDGDGHRVMLWNLAERPLPMANPAYHHEPAANPDPAVRRFVAAARRADALLLASPVYHSSYSGVLKNALDCVSMSEFAGKSVGLLAHGPQLTAVQVCDHLRIVVRSLYGHCVPEQAVTTPEDYDRDDSGDWRLSAPRMRARVDGLAAAVVKAAQR